MNLNEKIIVSAAVALCLTVLFAWMQSDKALGAAASGMASHATSSTIAVGPQEDKTLFTKNNTCANRVVSASGAVVYLSFHSSTNPSNVIGFPVAASSTVELDSDLYGCGAVTAAAAASSTITLSEFSQ